MRGSYPAKTSGRKSWEATRLAEKRQNRAVQGNIVLDVGCGEDGDLGKEKRWGGRGEVFKDQLAIHFTSSRTLTAKRLSIGEAATQTTFGSSPAPPMMHDGSPFNVVDDPVTSRPLTHRLERSFA